MKVIIVEEWTGEEGLLIGVYTDREKATQAMMHDVEHSRNNGVYYELEYIFTPIEINGDMEENEHIIIPRTSKEQWKA